MSITKPPNQSFIKIDHSIISYLNKSDSDFQEFKEYALNICNEKNYSTDWLQPIDQMDLEDNSNNNCNNINNHNNILRGVKTSYIVNNLPPHSHQQSISYSSSQISSSAPQLNSILNDSLNTTNSNSSCSSVFKNSQKKKLFNNKKRTISVQSTNMIGQPERKKRKR